VAPIIILVFVNYFHILLCLVKLQFTSFFQKNNNTWLSQNIMCYFSRKFYGIYSYVCLRMAALWLVLIQLRKETGLESLSGVINL